MSTVAARVRRLDTAEAMVAFFRIGGYVRPLGRDRCFWMGVVFVMGVPAASGPAVPLREDSSGGAGVFVRVLGRFDLTVGSRSVPVGVSCQRLLTLLAIREGQINRVHAAGLLWPDATSPRANANLRSVLWRLLRCCPEVVDSTFLDLRFSAAVATDFHRVQITARRLLDRSVRLGQEELRQALQCNLYDDIVPELEVEEWLAAEAERHRQMRLHALEALAEQLIAAGWFGAAVEAALGALRADPFRESACLLLVKAYLAEGNQLEAHKQYQRYCAVLRDEMGLEPSGPFRRLLGPAAARPAPPRPAPRPPARSTPARPPETTHPRTNTSSASNYSGKAGRTGAVSRRH